MTLGEPQPVGRWPYWRPAYEESEEARIASMSFYTAAEHVGTAYLEQARLVDEAIWNHRDLTVAWIMGNGAPEQPSPPAESMAKNILSVGSTYGSRECESQSCAFPQTSEDYEARAPHSNMGPAADGRIKPNIMAPGACVDSADYTDYSGCNRGTSFSAPLVAGSAALVRDYFARGYYPSGYAGGSTARTNSSAALVRAMIMSSGDVLDNATQELYPSGEQGWGRILLNDSLYFSSFSETRKLLVVDEWEMLPALSEGQTWTKQFTIADGHFRVFLAWTDRPPSLGDTTLVNDLDLTLSGSGCRTLGLGDCVGNNFVTDRGFGRRGPGQSRDHVNVEEAIFCAPSGTTYCAGEAGTYTVSVNAYNIVDASYPQTFALVIIGENATWV